MAPKKKKSRHESPLTGQATGAISSAPLKKKGRKEMPISKKSRIRAEKEALDKLEEDRLTALLFGSGSTNLDGNSSRNIDSDHSDNEQRDESGNNELDDEGEGLFDFEVDRGAQTSSDNDDETQEKDPDQAWNDEDEDDNGEHSVDMNDEEDDEESAKEGSAPVWEDPDDSKAALINGGSRLKKLRRSRQEKEALSSYELEQRLRQRYETSSQSTARTDWATRTKKQRIAIKKTDLDGSDDDDDEEAAISFFSTSKALLASTRNQLPHSILNIVRCPDANLTDPTKAVVRCIDFHPASEPDQPLMLTAGLDKSLRFFQVGEEKSTKIHGIHFPEMPIYSASFLGNTGKVVLSGRRKFFYFYDAISGKVDLVPSILGRDERSWEKHAVSSDGKLIAFVGNDGYVVLVDSHSKQSIGSLKLNGSVRAITFTPDGSEVLASGSDGDIYRWNVKSRQCIERFSNGDGTITSCLAASNTNLAVGAESGVVNLYSEHRGQQSRSSLLSGIQGKAPLKSIMNLHTSADVVRFNSDGQILAMSSQREQHGMKLLHVPSRTVFSNWPTAQTPLSYVWSTSFSPGSKFLAIGNDKGRCLLYKLNHYHN